MSNSNTTKIREQNDLARKKLMVIDWGRSIPCKVVHTQGIQALSDENRYNLYLAVCDFNDFTEDNDPHQEHDFGAFVFQGKKIFWKFDYLDMDLKYGSENPADTSQTMRVLTIMLAEEY